MSERRQLGEDEGVVALSEAVQVEDEAAEIAVAELACLAQVAGTTPRAGTRSEAGGLVRGRGPGGLALL
jgi:hypothetical protein